MRIGVHIYFQPSFGGGERYLLTAAEALRHLGDVDFLSPVAADLASFADAFALDLSGVRAVGLPRGRLQGARDWLARHRYDLFLALDNHLSPVRLNLGRRGILHLQTPPYPPPFDRPIRAWLKLRTYDLIVCNSEYTRRWVVRHGTAGIPVRVVYPPVDVALYRPFPKTRTILSVGRFFVGRHQKNHPLLIQCFSDFVRTGFRGWELHLAGSIRAEDPLAVAYLGEVRRLCDGLPVHLHVNPSLSELRRLYGEASIYWHAAGYGADEEATPQFLEHFGMSIVEAMAAGAIPVVPRRGGPLEIVRDGEDGFLWSEPGELVRITAGLADGTPERLEAMRGRARSAARRFSKDRFVNDLRLLAEELLEA